MLKSAVSRLRRRLLQGGLLLLVSGLCSLAQAETVLSVAAGAGYKRPVSELGAAFEKKTGIRVEYQFGNLGQVLTQALQNEKLSMVFGDQYYLEKNTQVSFDHFLPAGRGRLVLAWPAGHSLEKPEDLAGPGFDRVAIPDITRAIYGRAGSEFLERSGLAAKIGGHLLTVATVPQVSAYLLRGEVDAGFINMTEALSIRQKLGGYLEIDQKLYDPIQIAFGVVKGRESLPGVSEMSAFMQSDEARAILARYGL